MMTYLSGGCIFCKSRHWSVSTWRLKSGFFCSMSRNTIKQFYTANEVGWIAVTTSQFFVIVAVVFLYLYIFSNIIIVHECWIDWMTEGYIYDKSVQRNPLRLGEDSVCLRENAIFNKHRLSLCRQKTNSAFYAIARNMKRWPNSFKLPSLLTTDVAIGTVIDIRNLGFVPTELHRCG